MTRAGLTVLCVALIAFGTAHAQEGLTLTPADPVPRAQFGTTVTGKLTGFGGVSVTSAILGPCVARSLHTHSLTELLYVVSGSIESYQIREDNSVSKLTLQAEIAGRPKYPQAVVYPAGRKHLQYNPTCRSATFVAFFPGVPTGTPQVTTTNIPANQIPSQLPANIRAILTNGPVPTPFSAADSRFLKARPFTPAAAGTFSFPATKDEQEDNQCLRRCGLYSDDD